MSKPVKARGRSHRPGLQQGHTRGKERQKLKREARMKDDRVVSALEEARAEQEALEKRIAAEAKAPATGPALGAQYADLLKPEPEPEPTPPPAPRMAEQVRLVEPNKPKARPIAGKPEVLGDTRSITVEKSLWYEEVVMAGVDPRCVQILSETAIVIWNKPGQWRLNKTA